MSRKQEGDNDRIQIDWNKQKVIRAFLLRGDVVVEIEGAGAYIVEAEKQTMIDNKVTLLIPAVMDEEVGHFRNDPNRKGRMIDWAKIVVDGEEYLWADLTNNPQIFALWMSFIKPNEEMKALFPRGEEAAKKPVELPLPPVEKAVG